MRRIALSVVIAVVALGQVPAMAASLNQKGGGGAGGAGGVDTDDLVRRIERDLDRLTRGLELDLRRIERLPQTTPAATPGAAPPARRQPAQ
jgi:hypothetical protein